MGTPLITIFVRHSADCKYAGDEFNKRCNCRKHLRWTHNGKQYRQKAGTRSWAEAEKVKDRIEAQLSGRPLPKDESGFPLDEAVRLFLADKENQGVSATVKGKYERELERLQQFCMGRTIFTVQGLNREVLIAYAATWADLYPSTMTRYQVQARTKHFLRFCHESGWLDRVPRITPIKVDEPPTLPLTDKEYERLLKQIPVTFGHKPYAKDKPAKVRALVQLMRWTGLAIRDAVTLERGEIQHDKAKKLHRIVTARQKTGTHVSVPIRTELAEELLAVLNGNPRYVFWSGNGLESSTVTHWQDDMRTLFKDAKIESNGHMRSHRLRDTFAVDMLQKGVPLEEVSKLLGHESIKTTEKSYAKWVKGRQDRLDSLVTGTWTK